MNTPEVGAHEPAIWRRWTMALLDATVIRSSILLAETSQAYRQHVFRPLMTFQRPVQLVAAGRSVAVDDVHDGPRAICSTAAEADRYCVLAMPSMRPGTSAMVKVVDQWRGPLSGTRQNWQYDLWVAKEMAMIDWPARTPTRPTLATT